MHLIDATHYFITQTNICSATNEHAMEESSPAAKAIFARNSLPDRIIEGPPSNALTQQPESKEQIIGDLMQLKAEITNMGILISESPFKGKAKHPGLHYFNAGEWLQFAEIHFRHHVRQKLRIDNFLRTVVTD